MSDEEQQMQILKNIEKLQNMEKDLYKEIESTSSLDSTKASSLDSTKTSSLDSTKTSSLDSTVSRINQLAQVRISLYKSLNSSYKSLQTNINAKKTELDDMVAAVAIVEEELNNAKEQLNKLYEIKNNRMRMVEINTYYGKKYRAQTSLMKLIIFVGVFLLMFVILRKKGLLPESLANLLIGLVFAVGGFFIIRRTLDLSWRDNMSFDSYTWFYNPNTQVPTVYDYNKQKLQGLMSNFKGSNVFNGIDCIGNACCTAGMSYDTASRKCIKSIAPETFVTGQLTKHVFNNKASSSRKGGDSNPNYPAPYGDGETISFASY